MKTALISVADKKGIVPFAKKLVKLGVEIISTGGTAKLLRKSGVKVINISDYTGFPEMMDGRVKTLHPKIHAGILAVRSDKKHMQQLKKFKIKPIDLVVVNLYPFEKVISKKNVKLEVAMDNIDIGGPTILRAAAKNYENVSAVVDNNDFKMVVDQIERLGDVCIKTRRKLADKVFSHIAKYDSLIANYLNQQQELFPEDLSVHYHKVQDLRYGENPHQKAAFYKDSKITEPCITTAKQIHGKQLSFNNIFDANNALEIVKEFNRPVAAVIKHANPCGVARANTISLAYKKAHQADPMSAFGSIVALNRKCDESTAKQMKPLFIEVVICPSFSLEAKKILMKKKNIRLLEVGTLKKSQEGFGVKKVVGGALIQTRNCPIITKKQLKPVTTRKPSKSQADALSFAWRVNKHVKSNSIVLVKSDVAVGIGAGQMSRVDAVIIAVRKAGKHAKGSAMASDAFFPFPDGIEVAAKGGVTSVIQPGGSIRDAEVIETANKHKMTMVFTGVRLFNH